MGPDPSLIAAAACALALFGAAPLQAHPMPDTEVVVARDVQAASFVIRVPMSDLMLALPRQFPRDGRALLGRNQAALRAYFAAHTLLLTPSGERMPVTIGAIRLKRERNVDVGNYAELEVTGSARVDGAAPLLLAYDGVLHRVANHRARVMDRTGRVLGVIRYSLATKTATPLLLPPASF